MPTIDDLIRSAITDALAPLAARLDALERGVSPTPAPTPPPAPVPAPAPPIIVAAPPPARAGHAFAIGNSHISYQHADGPADLIDISRIAPSVPWTVYADPDNLIVAPSQQGKRADAFVALHMFGPTGGLDARRPVLMPDGTITPVYTLLDTLSSGAGDALISGRMPDPQGGRGRGIVSPYITWIGHRTLAKPGALENPSPAGARTNPHMPLYIGIRADGRIMFLTRRGECVDVGPVVGLTPGAQDLTFYPPNGLILFIADTFGGRIVKVDRTDSKAAILPMPSGKIEPSAKWRVSTLAEGFGKPTSLRCVEDGTLYVADNAAGAIYRLTIDPAGVTVARREVLCSLPGVFFIDTTSDGSLIAVTDQFAVHRIGKDGTVGPNLTPAWLRSPETLNFVTVSVDREGTWGPVDEFVCTKVNGAGNTDFYLWRNDDSVHLPCGPEYNGGSAGCGPTGQAGEVFGHYPWGFWFHPDQGIALAQGLSNPAPMVIRPALPTDPQWEYDRRLHWHGQKIIITGTTKAGGRYGKVPSFTAQIDIHGGGLVTCDEIADMGWDRAAAFIQSGMLGAFPRPEIVGYDLLAVLYWVARNSQRYLREGRALIDSLHKWAGPQTEIDPPDVPWDWDTQWAATYLVAGPAGVTGMSVYDQPRAIEPDVIIRVTDREGLLGERVIGEFAAPWAYTLPAGTYGLTARRVSGGAKLYRNRSQVVTVPPL